MTPEQLINEALTKHFDGKVTEDEIVDITWEILDKVNEEYIFKDWADVQL